MEAISERRGFIGQKQTDQRLQSQGKTSILHVRSELEIVSAFGCAGLEN